MSELPTKDQVLQWIADNPAQTSKRDIARAFGVKGADRIDLKRLLRELEDDGSLARRRKTYREPQSLPPVAVLTVLGPDRDGDLFAKPVEWGGEGPEPRVLMVQKPGEPALGQGDKVLARLKVAEAADHAYRGTLIRRIGTNPTRILGVFRKTAEGGRIEPVDKGADRQWLVARDVTLGAREGELVEAEQTGPKARLGSPPARVVARLGNPSAPKAVSLIAIHQHGLPHEFSDAAIAEADQAKSPALDTRFDMRDLPLVTIDPADARDHDDAVAALPDPDPRNEGGHVVWVAIADVANFVRPGSALDDDARERGNSTYFPDRVVPMLPDRLSGDLCSLHEGVERPCIAVRMVLDAKGQKLAHRFHRGLMRSRATLNYVDAQDAADGAPNDKTAPLMDDVIGPLFAAYEALKAARADRQPLDLDLPERKIVLSDEGKVVSVAFRDRLDAHKLIEEFMILANVCAAEELTHLRHPLLFRVHEEPSPEKLGALRDVAQASGFTLAKGQVLQTRHLNRLLAQAEGTDFDELINISTLRSMQQAYYNPANFGHFGLALKSYAHFTSPIRRYADLVVHRALISGHGWGDDGLSAHDIEQLEGTAGHISETERRSMEAERDTTDRYLASFLADRVGVEMAGRVTGVARFGIFVRLDQTGAEGLVPIRALGREYFHLDRDAQTLSGDETGMTIGIGQRVTVKLTEAVPVTGGLLLELVALEGAAIARRPARKGARPVARRRGAAKKAARKARRKVTRTRR